MLLGNDQHMHRRHRVDVAEGEDQFILEYLVGGNLAPRHTAKNTFSHCRQLPPRKRCYAAPAAAPSRLYHPGRGGNKRVSVQQSAVSQREGASPHPLGRGLLLYFVRGGADYGPGLPPARVSAG